MTLSGCNHLAHVFWQIQKFICFCAVFALFYFLFESNFQEQAPGGLYLEEQFDRGFLCYEFEGLIYLEGLIHGGASFWNFMVYCCSITEEPLLLSVYLTIVVNKAEIEKHIAISINSPDYYYNKWISL